jgi:hypothetical protein
VDKEDVALLTSGADSQHFRKKLIWLLSFQGSHLLNELNLLVVGELMSRQKPGPQLRMGSAGSGASKKSATKLMVASGRAVSTL